jgi:Na+/proline symporter
LSAGLIGGVSLTLATHGTDQFLVQRLLAAKSQRAAAGGLMLSGVLVLLQFALFLLIGIMLFAYYRHVPLEAPLPRTYAILPVFVVSTLSSGPAGFIVAAIVAAALSPSLNAMAATTVNDLYVPYVNPGAAEAELMRVSRVATVGWGLVQVAVALTAQRMERSVLDVGLAVLSLTAGPVLGAFLLAVAAPGVRSGAVVAAIVSGLLALGVIWWTSAAAFTWYPFIGGVVTILVAFVWDRLTKSPQS